MGAETVFLVPTKKGSIVRDPKTRAPLLETGALKPMTGPLGRYWRRRLRDGSVTVGKPPVQKPSVVPKVAATEKKTTIKGREEG